MAEANEMSNHNAQGLSPVFARLWRLMPTDNKPLDWVSRCDNKWILCDERKCQPRSSATAGFTRQGDTVKNGSSQRRCKVSHVGKNAYLFAGQLQCDFAARIVLLSTVGRSSRFMISERAILAITQQTLQQIRRPPIHSSVAPLLTKGADWLDIGSTPVRDKSLEKAMAATARLKNHGHELVPVLPHRIDISI
jgi:hypothetical protein